MTVYPRPSRAYLGTVSRTPCRSRDCASTRPTSIACPWPWKAAYPCNSTGRIRRRATVPCCTPGPRCAPPRLRKSRTRTQSPCNLQPTHNFFLQRLSFFSHSELGIYANNNPKRIERKNSKLDQIVARWRHVGTFSSIAKTPTFFVYIYMYNVHEIVHDRLANWCSYPVTQTTRESVI